MPASGVAIRRERRLPGRGMTQHPPNRDPDRFTELAPDRPRPGPHPNLERPGAQPHPAMARKEGAAAPRTRGGEGAAA